MESQEINGYNYLSVAELKTKIQKKGECAMLFAPSTKGQGLVEYAFILVLVALIVIAALMVLGPGIGNSFSSINNSLKSV